MATKGKAITLDDLTPSQPESDDSEYHAYAEDKIRQGQNDVENSNTLSEEKVWKALGVEP